MSQFGPRPPKPRVRAGIGFHAPSQPLKQAHPSDDKPSEVEGADDRLEAGESPSQKGGEAQPVPASTRPSERRGPAATPKTVEPVGSAPESASADTPSSLKTSAPKWLRRKASADATRGQGAAATMSLHREARTAERTKARRKLVVSRVLALVATAAVVAGISWLLLFSSVFALEEAEVKGAASDEVEDKVVSVVSHYLGEPLLRVPTGKIEETILQVPDVAEAQVRRSWPKSLLIEVEQRTPAAYISVGGKRSVVGADGKEVKESVAGDADLPLLVIESGSDVEGNAQAGVKVWESLSGDLAAQVDVIEMSRKRATLLMTDETEVVWGDSSESAEKAEVLELLREHRKAGVYDVADPRRPVTR